MAILSHIRSIVLCLEHFLVCTMGRVLTYISLIAPAAVGVMTLVRIHLSNSGSRQQCKASHPQHYYHACKLVGRRWKKVLVSWMK